MQRDKNNIGKSVFISIAILVLFAGCIDSLPPPEASPRDVVEAFVSEHGNYNLVSAEYKNTTSEGSFLGKIITCKPGSKHYEFVEVINGSERIEGDSATVEIRYLEKPDKPVFGESNLSSGEFQEMKNKTIYLTKENEGWRLRELNCELVGR
ncbi:MAG: hypothetical protein Q7U60_01480 [Candidatus Methanoperedens sp.]|nr:hypothetical protein [Candidatus Methanoperedens sp.]